ncbi:PREDICTED: dormancy-associated protein 2-like [Camelina sativa]|uniref:Dormancy-associated protein 2-like n=1 Tax=Camelina sativa TaxID=90675 RepID=A0ABM1QFB5_CAMSA|nr:PREDICTED: dormancy-associated protein 2-like [Camelina sativa]
MFDITTMRITKTGAPFVTNYAGKHAVLLIITLLQFKCTTVVSRGGAHAGGGGHAHVGGGHASVGGGHVSAGGGGHANVGGGHVSAGEGGHASVGGGHATEEGGHAVGGGGGHGEEEGGHGIGRGVGMVHRPAKRNGVSALVTPFADRFATAFLIIVFFL